MSMKHHSVRRKSALIAAVSLACASSAWAANVTWSGSGANNNFSTGANWIGDVAPVANDAIIFTGTPPRLAPTNDATNLTLTGISFASGASSFAVGGNALNLAGNINQSASANQIISAPLVLDNVTSAVNVTGGGTLTLGALTLGNAAQSSGVSTININNSVTNSTLLVRTNTATANTINIASGATWNTTGAVTIGAPPTSATATQTVLNVAGLGTWNVTTATNASFNVGLGSGNNNFGQPQHTLDMTGLSNFVYSTGATGTGIFGVGNLVTRPTSTARLANTSNSITAASVVIGDSNQSGGNNSGGSSTLFLGAGANVLNANTFTIGNTKGNGAMSFQTTTGSVNIAGQAGGTSRANMTIGRGSSATDTNTARQVQLAGHTANVQANNVILGHLNGATGGTTAGVITFDTGTFDVNNLTLGLDQSGSAGNGARGTFTLGTDASSTGVLNVNTSMLLGNVTNGATGTKTTTAIFTINGGTANLYADITTNKNAAAIGTTVNSTLTMNAGTLNMNGKNIGGAAAPIGSITLNGGTLSNAGRITGTTTVLGSGLTMTGSPVFALPDAGTLTSNLASFTLPSGGGIEGGGPGGAGTVNGDVVNGSGARIAPGSNSVAGILNFSNNLTLNGGSIVKFKLSENAGSGNDQVNVTSNLTLAGAVNVDLGILGAGPQNGNVYTLFTYGGTLSGDETNFSLPNLNTRTSYSIVPTATTPNSIQLSVTGGSPLAITWVGNVNNNWNLIGTANFQDGVPAPQQFYNQDTVTFDDTSTNTNSVQVVGTLSPANVIVNGTRDYKFAGSGAISGGGGLIKNNTGTLTIVNSNTYSGLTHIQGGTLQIGDGGTTGSLASPIQADGTLLINRSDNFTLGNVISGGGIVRKIGSNTLTLSGSSSYTGQTIVDAGTLQVTALANAGVNSNIGAGTGGPSDLVLNGSTFKFVGNANQTSNRNFTMSNAGATIDASPTVGAVALTLNGTGAIAFPDAGPRTLVMTGTELTPLLIGTNAMNLVITDQDGATGQTSVVKNGNNRWQFGGGNSYSGGTTINAGGIRAANASAFGTGAVTVASGAQAYLNVAGTFSNNFSITGTGPAEAPGTEAVGNYGALRIANNGAGVSGTVTLTGDARITGRSANTGGNISGQITGAHNLEFGNSGGGGGNVVISNSLNDWTGNTTVSHGALKTGGVDVIPRGAGKGNVIINNSSATIDSTLDLLGNSQQINGLVSAGADMTRVKVTNSSGAATLTVGNNDATAVYNGVLLDGAGALGLAKVGTGMQTITGVNTYSGGTTVSGGTLRVSGAGTLGSTSAAVTNDATLQIHSNNTVGDLGGAGSLTVGNGAIGVTLNANHVRQATLDVAANSTLSTVPSSFAAGVSIIDTLNLAAGARFDLKDNKLFTLNSAGNADINGVYSGVQGEVQRASNGGAWDSPGLTTSMPDAASGLTSIGVATGEQVRGLGPTDTDIFAGQTITGATTIAMYTYAGDANLDGFISGDDYSTIDFNVGTGADGWVNGDFNYDGIVSGDDYSTIDFNYAAQGAPFFTSGSGGAAALAGVTAVPEPAVGGLLTVAAAALLGRRRRRV
jgi:autotransporter-associated beta strand protein